MGIEILTIWKGMLINMRKIKILSIIIYLEVINMKWDKEYTTKNLEKELLPN